MKGIKKAVMKVGALTMAAVMMLGMQVSADNSYLEGNSTQENHIETKNPSSLITTIETNYHAQGITGFVVLTPDKTINSILGIKEEEHWQRGVTYIANTTCGEKAIAAFQAAADQVQGKVLWYFDIQFFKWDGTWNEPVTSLSSPVKFAIGIGESDRDSNRDFAMLRLHDGVATLLPDLDDDEYTVTFESDRFSTYALISYPKGNTPQQSQAPAQESQTPAQPQTPAQSQAPAQNPEDELDEVPKTGDGLATAGISMAVLGAALVGAGFLGKRYNSR